MGETSRSFIFNVSGFELQVSCYLTIYRDHGGTCDHGGLMSLEAIVFHKGWVVGVVPEILVPKDRLFQKERLQGCIEALQCIALLQCQHETWWQQDVF